jgi:hypothetical protein
MPTQRRLIFMLDPIGTAPDGIGIRGSTPTPSFLATEFSTARLAGDFTRRSTLDGGHSGMDSGTVTDSAGAIITTSIMTITRGGLVSITIRAFAAVGSPLVAARRAFTVVKVSEAEALAEDSMGVAEALEEVVTAAKIRSQRWTRGVAA